MTNLKAASATANRFIELGMNDGRQLTPMQILKLVFLAHGWMLGLHGRPLIKDRIEAWKYGPVIPVLYSRLKKYGAEPVTEFIDVPNEKFSRNEDDVIQQVYQIYGELSGPELSDITHEDGSPWARVYRAGELTTEIANDLIESFYEQKSEPTANRAGSSDQKRTRSTYEQNSQQGDRRTGPADRRGSRAA